MIFSVLKTVYREKLYLIITIINFLFFLIVTITVSNIKLLIQLVNGSGDVFLRLIIFFNLLKGITTNFTFINLVLAFFIALLFSVYMSLFIFFVKQRKSIIRGSKKGFLASLLGLAGVGCSSCGAIILSMFLSTAATASVIYFLPLRGTEFAILGIIILYLSIHSLAKNIVKGDLCTIN